MNFPDLNLPAFPARIQSRGNTQEIWDVQRGKFVLLTPEEWVRQHVLHYLLEIMRYPAGLIAVEKEIQVIRTRKRFDIVVYSHQLQPWMLVECKSYDVPLNQSVLEQAGRYNISLQAPYLAVTNGMQYVLAEITDERKGFVFLKEFPNFPH